MGVLLDTLNPMGLLDRFRRKPAPLAVPDPSGRYALVPTAAYWAELIPVLERSVHGALDYYISDERAARMPPRTPAEQAWYDAVAYRSIPHTARDLISARLSLGTWTRADLLRDLAAWVSANERYIDAATRAAPDATPLDLEDGPGLGRTPRMILVSAIAIAILLDADDDTLERLAAIADRYAPERLTDLILAGRIPARAVASDTAQPFLRLARAWTSAPVPSIESYIEAWYRQFSKPSFLAWEGLREQFDGRLDWTGTWCFEAAAAVRLLGVDDGPLRSIEFYPSALVDLGDASRE